jgi:hypothetical protein
MFKNIKRLRQTKKDMVVSLVIEKVGLFCAVNTVVFVEWSRGNAASDSTPEFKLRMQGDKNQAQNIEVEMNHIFRKKTTLYFDQQSQIQKKICNFKLKAKKLDGGWVEFNEEFDFSQFATLENRQKEHKFDVKFRRNDVSPDFKDGYIIGKIQVVEFLKDDVNQIAWINEGQTNVGRRKGKNSKSGINSSTIITGVPDINILETYYDEDGNAQQREVDLNEAEQKNLKNKFMSHHFRVMFQVQTIKINTRASS